MPLGVSVTASDTINQAPSREEQRRMAETADDGVMRAADGTPLKISLARALRRQKLRALGLTMPLLLFIVLTFLAPIGDMLFRAVENQIVPETLPRTVAELDDWDPASGEAPGEDAFRALYLDMFIAAETKEHTALGSRLNYETSGMASLFRSTGRDLDDMGEAFKNPLQDINEAWDDAAFWHAMMAAGDGRPAASALAEQQLARLTALSDGDITGSPGFAPAQEIADILPQAAAAYTDFAYFTELADGDSPAEEEPWEAVHAALAMDLTAKGAPERIAGYAGPGADELREALANLAELPPVDLRQAFADSDQDWLSEDVWTTIYRLRGTYTKNYFLTAVDLEETADGSIEPKPDDEAIYMFLFERTLFMSVTITFTCLLLGYPIAWLLSNLPLRVSNLLLILVLLPFWTSLLVRTSSWIVLLQQEGVINDFLVAIGVIGDDGRLQMMFNQTGTIIAMTHILLPFMILPLYSVMKTIPPSYLRAAKSLGATDWTAFWRVYFPNTIPGIGAGAILVFILSIGYYITPELVGGTSGTFISNRIAYHISSSLNWGLAAALASILLFVVLILYYLYDRIVGIDNVKLG